MKTPLAVTALAAALMAGPAAQAQSALAQPAQRNVAATLPNTFDDPAARARAVQAAPPPAPASATANPRAEAALRAVIADFAAGEPDYDRFTDDLAERLRVRADELVPLIQGFGPLESVEFVGHERGADLFLAVFAEARTQWIVGLEDDKITALLFRPAPAAP